MDNSSSQHTRHNFAGLRPKGRRVMLHLSSPTMSGKPSRLSFLNFMPEAIRNHFIAMAGEFTGTFLFLFFAFSGAQVANTKVPDAAISSAPDPASLLYISLSFGFSLAVNAWVFFRISGGLFNPAVGALPWVRGGFLTVSQILGAITSAAVVAALFPGPLNVRTSLLPGTSLAQGLFIEMFLSAQLVFTIFMLAAEKHKATFIAPVGIGLSLFIAELTGVYYTGGSVNPARSFGPSVVLHSFYSYDWVRSETIPLTFLLDSCSNRKQRQIYWLGPALGALLASGFYKFIKILEYETANPGQDFNEQEQEFYDPSKDTSRPIVNLAPDGSAHIVDEISPAAHEPHPDCLAPHPRQPQDPASQQGQPASSSRGRENPGTDFAGDGGHVGWGTTSSEARYQYGPEIEAAKATPRQAGRV
ncbi:MAG: hypothetical protein L6R35_002901 [Caloplaca aegaea]|nr:MAG: hypothetical protein L6R35_002901 [Caloplaca aegaea]